jgi:hypothetical protein
MLGLQHPYVARDRTDTSEAVEYRIVHEDGVFSWDESWQGIGGPAELVLGMLDRNPSTRLTVGVAKVVAYQCQIAEILAHPFLAVKGGDLTPYTPPLAYLPSSVPSPCPSVILQDLCFLAYLNGSFTFCQTTKEMQERLSDRHARWEKVWAGFLYKWYTRVDSDWEDTPKVASPPIRKSCGYRCVICHLRF